MSQLSLNRLLFGQKFAFFSSHYTSSSHPRFALSVHILPVRHFAVRKLPNPKVKQYWRPEEEQLPLGHLGAVERSVSSPLKEGSGEIYSASANGRRGVVVECWL